MGAEYSEGRYVPRPGREWISGGVVAVGLGLVAVGAWPRRRRETTDYEPDRFLRWYSMMGSIWLVVFPAILVLGCAFLWWVSSLMVD